VATPGELALESDLGSTPFPELLGVLDASASTGQLTVQADQTIRRFTFVAGRLAEVDGAPVDIEAAAGWLADLVLELCAAPSGPFSFEPAPAPGAPTTDLTAEQLLGGAERRVAQWQQVTAHVPSTKAVPRLVSHAPSDEPVVVAAADWPILALVDGRRAVAEVVVESGRRPFDVFETLARLVVVGLVAID
jgi:hypothetical protein